MNDTNQASRMRNAAIHLISIGGFEPDGRPFFRVRAGSCGAQELAGRYRA